MCYICNCFSWTLDLIQRLITFALGCVMVLAICCGLSVAVLAGIAYGYNYSMAEFLTFARSDITVYMRRGQFLDRPDFQPYRRSGDSDENLFSLNGTADYQEENVPSDTKPLSDTWLKAEDTRKYAEKLTKFSSQEKFQEKLREPMVITDNLRYYKLTTPPNRLISIVPNRAMSTTIVESGFSDIIIRNFRPVEQLTQPNPTSNRDYDYVNFDKKAKEITESDRIRPTIMESNYEQTPAFRYVESINDPKWSRDTITNSPPTVIDYPKEDTDEDNIVYKPL